MATKNHARARRATRGQHRLIRRVMAEWAVVVTARTVAVLVLMVLEQLLHFSPCAR